MAEASVTIKLNPAEFDLVRDSIKEAHAHAMSAASATDSPKERQEIRAKALRLQDLGGKLGA